jgi:hypothetical protein
MVTSSITRARHLLTAGALALIACAALLFPAARPDARAHAEPAAAARQRPTWIQPTRPDARYVCDWKLPFAQGVGDVRLEYTQQLPQSRWLGKLHTKYQDGTTRVQLIHLFDPRPIRRIGTEWSFETTDSRIRCKMMVTKGSAEVRLGNCSNKLEQTCVDQRLLDIFTRVPDSPCQECSSQGLFDRVPCVTRCLSRLAGQPASFSACVTEADPRFGHPQRPSPVACMLITYYKALEQPSFPREFVNHHITYYGLQELRQNWIDFVNSELGECTGSHFCPGGTSCVGGTCQEFAK